MRIPGTRTAPLPALSAEQKLAIGSMLAIVGAIVVVLAPRLGWTQLDRPWSFLIGLLGGITAGAGVPLSICGLVGVSRRK